MRFYYLLKEMSHIENLLMQGEGYTLEFKQSVSKDLGVEICAFANAQGGTILIGVDDSGTVVGIDKEKTNRLLSKIQDIVSSIDPLIEVSLEVIENIIKVIIPRGIHKPYMHKGMCYIRQGSSSQKLTRSEIVDFFQQEGLVRWDEMKSSLHYEAISPDAWERFLKATGIDGSLEVFTIMDNLGIFVDEYCTNAGFLLFTDSVIPKEFQASILCMVYQGTNKTKILDQKEFSGDMYMNFQSIMTYLLSKLNTEYVITGRGRNEILELPEEALREAVVNALVHRDYTVRGAHILVEIFLDRVEITSPGGLVKGVDESNLGKRSLSRNGQLFGILQRMDLVEKIGSGMKRIKDSMNELEMIYEIDYDNYWFNILFWRKGFEPKSIIETIEKSSEKSSEKITNREKIIALFKKNKHISAVDIGKMIGISSRAVEKNIRILQVQGKLKRVGPDKGGYWKIL